MKGWKDGMEKELVAEQELLDVIELTIGKMKKETHEGRREKERLIIAIKSNQKIMDCLYKRREMLQ